MILQSSKHNFYLLSYRPGIIFVWRKKVPGIRWNPWPLVEWVCINFNSLKTKRRLLYLKTQFVPRSKHFHLGYKNQSVYAVSGTNRCLFSDKNKTHKCSVGRTYSCWMLNCWCITWPVGFKRLNIGCKCTFLSVLGNNFRAFLSCSYLCVTQSL